jgi:hypothetical protein
LTGAIPWNSWRASAWARSSAAWCCFFSAGLRARCARFTPSRQPGVLQWAYGGSSSISSVEVTRYCAATGRALAAAVLNSRAAARRSRFQAMILSKRDFSYAGFSGAVEVTNSCASDTARSSYFFPS